MCTRRRPFLLFLLTALLLPGAALRAQDAQTRTWTDRSGHALEAVLVGLQGPRVVLEKDGVRRTFLLDTLSYDDRRYVEEQVAAWKRADRKERLGAYQFKLDEEVAATLKTRGVWNEDGLYPKSREAVKERVKALLAAGRGSDREQALALLNVYRYLCDVPCDVTLDEVYSEKATAAAEVCARLGRLDHAPPNPGMPEERYQLGREGAGGSNLFGGGGMPSSVHGYMNDSDPGNIDRVGHRRWCLNPRMGKTGFGAYGNYAAMWSMDGSRTEVPDFDFVAFPPRGYMPVEYFR